MLSVSQLTRADYIICMFCRYYNTRAAKTIPHSRNFAYLGPWDRLGRHVLLLFRHHAKTCELLCSCLAPETSPSKITFAGNFASMLPSRIFPNNPRSARATDFVCRLPKVSGVENSLKIFFINLCLISMHKKALCNSSQCISEYNIT